MVSVRFDCGIQMTANLMSGAGWSFCLGTKKTHLPARMQCARHQSWTRGHACTLHESTADFWGEDLEPSIWAHLKPQTSKRPDSIPSSSMLGWYMLHGPWQSRSLHNRSSGNVETKQRTGWSTSSFHWCSASQRSRNTCVRNSTEAKTATSGADLLVFWSTSWSPNWTEVHSSSTGSMVAL